MQRERLPELGDHIKVYRNAGIGYWHHGIISQLAEDGMPSHVIHYYSIGRKAEACITETEFKYFVLDSRQFQFADEDGYHPYSKDTVLRRARAQIDKANYNLLGKNCEHFAMWCRTDRATSRQVVSAGNTLIGIGMIVSVLFTILGVTVRSLGSR